MAVVLVAALGLLGTTASGRAGDPTSEPAGAEAGQAVDWGSLRALLFLQETLTMLGYVPGPVDGVYGPRTRSTVEWFQEDYEMAPDGRLSRALFATLMRARLAQDGLENLSERVDVAMAALEASIIEGGGAAPPAIPARDGSDIGALSEGDPFPGEDEAGRMLAALPALPGDGSTSRPGGEAATESRTRSGGPASGDKLETIAGLMEREAEAGRLSFCDNLADCRAEAEAAATEARDRGAQIPAYVDTIVGLALEFSFSESGRDVDEPTAARLFRAAAEDGHPWAQFALGFLSLIGEGLEPDLDEAEFWLGQAAAADLEVARRMLDIVRSVP